MSDADKERFLREAEILTSEELSIGVTASRRLRLRREGLAHDAHFQIIDESKPFHQFKNAMDVNFRDSYRFNIAAYHLDRLLDLRMTPVSIERRISGRLGALTWWVDDVQMMELDRRRRKIAPPDKERWDHDMDQGWLFQELIYNTDPNVGNLLIDREWNLWLIDFTRAFRLRKEIQRPNYLLHRIDRRLWGNLQRLDAQMLRKRMQGSLSGPEVRSLLERRDAIAALIQKRIAREGETAVICDAPEH